MSTRARCRVVDRRGALDRVGRRAEREDAGALVARQPPPGEGADLVDAYVHKYHDEAWATFRLPARYLP